MRTPIRVTNRFHRIFIEAMTAGSQGLRNAVMPQFYPLAATAVRTKASKAEADNPYKPREDHRGHPGAGSDVVKQHRSAKASFDGYAIPSGTISTDPDIGPAMECLGWSKRDPGISTTIASSPSSTTTTLQVATSVGIKAGDVIIVNQEAARVLTSDAASAGVLTIWPPLSAAPSSGDTVKTAITYVPDNERDVAEESAAAWIGASRTQMRVEGLVGEKWAFAFGGDDAGNITFDGSAREAHRITSSLLDGGINDSVTQVVATTADFVPDDVSAAKPVYLTIEADGTNAEEHVRCTGKVSATALTIVRAQLTSSNVAHLGNAVIRPYWPDDTVAGTPVPAILGSVVVGIGTETVRNELQLKSAALEADLAVNKKEDVLGQAWKLQGYSLAMRNIEVSMEGWGDADTMAWARNAEDYGAVHAMVQQGDTEGSIFGFCANSVLFDNPADDPSADEMGVTLKGRALATSPESDTDPKEIIVFFG